MKTLLALCLFWTSFAYSQAVETFFCPVDGKKLLERQKSLIEREDKAILMEAYTLTDMTLVESLCSAKVPVTILLDGKYGVASSSRAVTRIANSKNVVLKIDRGETAHGGISHTKIMIFKGQGVTRTGSGNFTVQSRTRNHEAVYIITAKPISDAHEADFNVHLAHCDEKQAMMVPAMPSPGSSAWQKMLLNPSLLPISDGTPNGYLYVQRGEWQVGFESGGVSYRTTIPDGVISDGTSIPRWVESVSGIERDGLERRASWLHDNGYINQGRLPKLETLTGSGWQSSPHVFSKSEVDQAFKWLLLDSGVSATRAEVMYEAVHLFGGSAWKSHSK